VLHVPFPRPRDRKEVLEHPDYYRLREQIVSFLEDQGHHGNDDPGAVQAAGQTVAPVPADPASAVETRSRLAHPTRSRAARWANEGS